jgi:hypothetical protein
MEKSLLDTDILSEYLKGLDRNVVRHAADYARQHRIFTFTSVTVHESFSALSSRTRPLNYKKP